MIERLKMIGLMYAFPAIMAFVVYFGNGIQINGDDATAISRLFFGFSLGIAIEGFVMIIFATVAAITGRFD